MINKKKLNDMQQEVVENVMEHYKESGKDELVVICIGTPKSMGDSIGPLTGSKLDDSNIDLKLYGTISDPIHFLNLQNKMNEINLQYPNAFKVAIDACISYDRDVHDIIYSNYGISPGKGLDKKCDIVGDCSIKGIICKLTGLESNHDIFKLVNAASLNSVDLISDLISDIIIEIDNNIKNQDNIANEKCVSY